MPNNNKDQEDEAILSLGKGNDFLSKPMRDKNYVIKQVEYPNKEPLLITYHIHTEEIEIEFESTDGKSEDYLYFENINELAQLIESIPELKKKLLIRLMEGL